MTKPKTLDQLRAEKERAETQLAQEKHKLERLENRKKYLGQACDRERRHSMGLLSPRLTAGTRQAWQRRQGFYRYLSVAALPCSIIPTPPDDEQSPGIFHLQEDFE